MGKRKKRGTRFSDAMKYRRISEFVASVRKKLNISDEDLSGPLPELSCIAFGEFHNLLWRGLLCSREGTPKWDALQYPEILDGMYEEILKMERQQNLRSRAALSTRPALR